MNLPNFGKHPQPGVRVLIAWILLLLACTAAYYTGIGPYLVFDDFNVLVPLLDNQTMISTRDVLLSQTGSLGRPVSMISFILNIGLFGPDVEPIKLINIVIHLITGLLLYFLTRRLIELSGIVTRNWLPVIVAGSWLLHPLHVSTVLYAVQRMTLLSSLFMVAGLLSYVTGRVRVRDNRQHGFLLIGVTYLLCLPLAVLSKENGFILPLYIFLIEILFFKSAKNLHFLHYENLLRWGPVIIPVILGLTWLLASQGRLLTEGYATREFTLYERLLTETRVIASYIHMTLIPDLTRMSFLHDNLSISTGPLKPPTTLLSLALLISLPALAIAVFRRWPVIAFALLFFLASHLIESTVVPLDLMYEHRTYLASYGLLMAGILTLHHVISSKRLRVTLGIVTILLLGGLLAMRSGMWSDEKRLHEYLHHLNPGSDQIASQLADIYMRHSRPDLAISALSTSDSPGRQAQRLYIKCRTTGALDHDDIRLLQANLGVTAPNYLLTGLIQLAGLGLDNQCRYDMNVYADLLTSALARPLHNTDRYRLLLYRAQLQHASGRLGDALVSLAEAHKAWQIRPEPLLLAAEWLARAGRIPEARTYYNDAKALARLQHIDAQSAEEQIEHLLDKAGTKPPVGSK